MQTFEEIVTEPRYRDSVRRADRFGTARVGISEMCWKTGELKNIKARYSALTLYKTPSRIKHVICGEDRPVRSFMPGDLMLRPPNLDYDTEYHAPVEITVFAIENELVQNATTAFAADVGSVFSRLEARPFRSPLIEGLARQLADATNRNADRLYVDSLTNTLIHELWRMADGTVLASETDPGALAPGQMRKVDELIDTARGASLTAEMLAQTVAMSMTAFSAALKQTTGMTPYKYVLSRRLDGARNLLQTTGLPLAEIAYRCGFGSQSHMTDVFRAKLGMTPGKLRAAHRTG